MPNNNSPVRAFEEQNESAGTGNASNPSPKDLQTENVNQLLDKKAEKYLWESGNIEDLPDAQDEEELNKDVETK